MTTNELYFLMIMILFSALVLLIAFYILTTNHRKEMEKEHKAFSLHLSILQDVLMDNKLNPEYVMNQYLALIKYCNENEYIFRRIHENLYEIYKKGQYVKRRGTLLDLTRYLLQE